MAFLLTVGGVDKTANVSLDAGINVSMPLNERATMRVTFLPGYQPSKRAEIIAYEQDGTTKLFGGVVLHRRASHGGVYGTTPMYTSCECGDFSVYADWCYQTKTYTTTKTLKQVLADLVADALTAYSITLHGSQVDGPTLAAFSWEDKKVSDCLRELADKTGYYYRIDADKVLRMEAAGTNSAPFSVTDATPNVEDVEWSDSTEVPANKITVRCGPAGVGTETIAHTWTADSGVTTVWALDGENVPASSVWPGVVVVNSVTYPMHLPGEAPGGNGIEWDYATDGGTLSFLGTSTSLIAGTEPIVLTYYPQFPFRVSVNNGGSPVIEKLYTADDVTTYDGAVDLAEGLLDQVGQEPRTVVMPTTTSGVAPGDSMTVNVSTGRSFNATCTVTQVDVQMVSGSFWRYRITAQETSTAVQSDYLGQWRTMLGGGGGGGTPVTVSGGGSSSSTTVLASPFPLGGKRDQSQTIGTTRTAVIDWLPFVAAADQTVRVRATVRARDSGVRVTPHLEVYNSGTMAWDSHQAGSGATGATAAEQTFAAALTSGETYRLGYVTDTASASAYCIGQLESVA